MWCEVYFSIANLCLQQWWGLSLFLLQLSGPPSSFKFLASQFFSTINSLPSDMCSLCKFMKKHCSAFGSRALQMWKEHQIAGGGMVWRCEARAFGDGLDMLETAFTVLVFCPGMLSLAIGFFWLVLLCYRSLGALWYWQVSCLAPGLKWDEVGEWYLVSFS